MVRSFFTLLRLNEDGTDMDNNQKESRLRCDTPRQRRRPGDDAHGTSSELLSEQTSDGDEDENNSDGSGLFVSEDSGSDWEASYGEMYP